MARWGGKVRKGRWRREKDKPKNIDTYCHNGTRREGPKEPKHDVTITSDDPVRIAEIYGELKRAMNRNNGGPDSIEYVPTGLSIEVKGLCCSVIEELLNRYKGKIEIDYNSSI